MDRFIEYFHNTFREILPLDVLKDFAFVSLTKVYEESQRHGIVYVEHAVIVQTDPERICVESFQNELNESCEADDFLICYHINYGGFTSMTFKREPRF